MTTETITPVEITAPAETGTPVQPTIQVPMPAKPDLPGTIPSSYAGYPGLHYIDPITKKTIKAVPARFIENLGYVGHSKIHGLGCFAKNDIISGQFIEEVSAIILDTTVRSNTDYVITRYLFTWPCEQNDAICNEHGNTFFIPTGNAMLYNHSDNPNAYWIYDKAMKRLFLSSLRDIAKGEEITWYYGHGYAERLKADPTGEGQATKPNPQNKGCSSCEERQKAQKAQQTQQTQQARQAQQAESELAVYSPKITVNRSMIFSDIGNVAPETENTTNETNVEFRSMVVPENKLNDTIQDSQV